LSVGYVHFRLTFDNGVKGSGNAAFANLGCEWKWRFGLGILLGAPPPRRPDGAMAPGSSGVSLLIGEAI
jgi:hypothetical protein